MKYSKSNTLRTQEAIARFGKSARYPLCLAALDLWRNRAELIEVMKKEVSIEKTLNSAKQLKEKAEGAIKQLRGERKENEANLWAAELRNIDMHLAKVQTCYEATVALRFFCQDLHQWAAARFNRERAGVVRGKDVQALRALQRVRKRWNNKKSFLGDTDRRTLEILKMHRSKAFDKAKNKYLEAAQAGDRELSGKAWQRLLKAKEIQSCLVDAPADKDAKEVRRLAKKLGIQLAKDKRGRRRKPYLRKQKPKQPRRRPGRPRTKVELIPKGDIAQTFDELFREGRGRTPRQPSKDQFWDSTEARRTAAQKRSG